VARLGLIGENDDSANGGVVAWTGRGH
jgi:hypothetical protein